MFRVGKLFVSIPGDPSIRERWKNIFRSILNLNGRNGDKYMKRERQIRRIIRSRFSFLHATERKKVKVKKIFRSILNFQRSMVIRSISFRSTCQTYEGRKKSRLWMISFLRPIEYKRTEIKKENCFVKKIFWSILNFQQSVNNLFDYEGRKADHRMIRSRFPLFVQRNGKEIRRKRVKVKKIFQSILNFHRSMNNDFLSSSNEESNTK